MLIFLWQQKKLKDLTTFYSGLTYHPDDIVRNGVWVIRSSNIKNNNIINRDNVFVRPNIVNKTFVQMGDIIVVVRNGSKNLIGKHAQVKKEITNSVIGAFMTGLRGKDNTFLNALLDSELFKKEIEKDLGTTINQITTNNFKNMKFIVPLSDEKNKIGNLISTIDTLIFLQQQKLEQLTRLKQGLLQKIFSKNLDLRFKKFLTHSWSQIKLNDMGSPFTGLSGKNKSDFGHGKAKFIPYVNVFQNAITSLQQLDKIEIDSKQNSIKYGDVFFTTSSETPEEVGMSSVWLGNEKNVYLNSFCFGYRPTIKINPYYLAYMFRSPLIRKKFMILAQGISRYNISKKEVMKLTIPVPQNLEQEKIGNLLVNVDKQIEFQKNKITKLEQIKKFLLQNMFI